CMVTINLTPIEKTCRIEDTDREYNIMKNSKLKNPELIILILSAPKNLDKRDTVRETWINSDQLLHLSSEQSKNNDILILPMLDTYKSLTEKVKRSFVWLNDQYDYGLGFKYVLKCDDDSFVNLKSLTSEIVAMENFYHKLDLKQSFKSNLEQTNFYLSMNAQEVPELKLKESGKKMIGSHLIDMYHMLWVEDIFYQKKLVTYIAKNTENLRSYQSEDVSVGFWLAPVNNVLRVHDVRFDTEWISRGCRNSHLVTHNISRQEMRKMYNNYIEFRTFCPEQVDKRSYYVYDWSVPPSQCCHHFDESIIRLQKR
ncbi:hypothetical protein NQ314_009909, partial [Rhamnusium bicolor]